MSWTSNWIRMRTCLYVSSRITTAIIPILAWHCTKHRTDGSAELLFVLKKLASKAPWIDYCGRDQWEAKTDIGKIELRHWELEFEIEDKVFLKVSPARGTWRFRQNGKLARDTLDLSRYSNEYRAYRLALPSKLFRVHKVFICSCSEDTSQTRRMYFTMSSLRLERMQHIMSTRWPSLVRKSTCWGRRWSTR